MLKAKNKVQIFLYLILTIFFGVQLKAQNKPRYSMSAGVGYFMDIEDIGFEIGTNNPRLKGVHGAVGTFLEFNYLLKSNYWVGFKYLEADLMYPFNDRGALFWSENKMISFDVYALLVKKSFKKEKSIFDISAGPLLNDYNGTDFDYNEYGIVDFNNTEYMAVLEPTINNYHFLDLGLFVAFEYKYNITRSVYIGMKADCYGLLYIGKQALTLTPLIEIRI